MNPIGKKIVEIVIKTALMALFLWIFISMEWMDLWVIPSDSDNVTAFSLWWITNGMDVLSWILTISYGIGFITLIEVVYWAMTKILGIFIPSITE